MRQSHLSTLLLTRATALRPRHIRESGVRTRRAASFGSHRSARKLVGTRQRVQEWPIEQRTERRTAAELARATAEGQALREGLERARVEAAAVKAQPA